MPIASRADAPRLYWIDPEQRLVARIPGRYCVGSPAQLVEEILDQLAAGPSERDRAAGLGSALPSRRWVDLATLDGDLAVLRVTPDAAIGANRVTLAAAQVVLAVTSIAGISRVELVHDDDALQVPLPDGELADGPLTASAYLETLAVPRHHTTDASDWPTVRCPGGGPSAGPRR
ncbi:Sporulation and spore germination [Nocardioides terrae]|uniref:Sporulation and spore germination n=1 Tax=Nocardioides terrae TaxID=574651 RepID=A0A1I1JK20_9ACTN|nr:GerMN domain-containing protein [Nocardioides terrae]SFC48897.1 Sporulation and spore germination [Nocardioides terrae]